MNDEQKMQEMEQRLDNALLKVFDLEAKQKSDSLVRYELEEILRSIYYECKRLKESEEKPTIDELLGNLSENIRKMFIDYKIRF